MINIRLIPHNFISSAILLSLETKMANHLSLGEHFEADLYKRAGKRVYHGKFDLTSDLFAYVILAV
jgi:hypothetical protein